MLMKTKGILEFFNNVILVIEGEGYMVCGDGMSINEKIM